MEGTLFSVMEEVFKKQYDGFFGSDARRIQMGNMNESKVTMLEVQLRSDFFDCFKSCQCAQCIKAGDVHSSTLPCWFEDPCLIGKIIRESLLYGLKDPNPNTREESISTFNLITDYNHKGHESDVIHLKRIRPAEMWKLVLKKKLKKESMRMLEMCRLILIISYKFNMMTFFNIFQVKEQLRTDDDDNLPVLPTPYDYEMLSDRIRSFFLTSINYLVTIAFLDRKEQARKNRLPLFNAAINGAIAHIFCVGYGYYPWTECFLYNFRPILKAVWTYSTSGEKIELPPISYPVTTPEPKSRAKMTESFFPRLPKNAKCDVCFSKLSKSAVKLFPLEFMWSRVNEYYPREVLLSSGSSHRSVGIACRPECVLQAEAETFPELKHLLANIKCLRLDKANALKIQGSQGFPVIPLDGSTKHKLETLLNGIPNNRLQLFAQNALLHGAFIKLRLFHQGMEGFMERADTAPIKYEIFDEEKLIRNYAKIESIKSESGAIMKSYKVFNDELQRYQGLDWEGDGFGILKEVKARLAKGIPSKELKLAKRRCVANHVTFSWKRQWGMFSIFIDRDFHMTVNIEAMPDMKLANFKNNITREQYESMLEFCFRDKKSVFVPVSHLFVRCRSLEEDCVRFLVSPTGDKDGFYHMKSLLETHDYLMFAHGLDLEDRHCDGGFLKLCKKNAKLDPNDDDFEIIGYLNLNFYRYIMEEIEFSDFCHMFSAFKFRNYSLERSILRPDDDQIEEVVEHTVKTPPALATRVRKVVLHFFRLAVMRETLRKLSENELPIPEMPLMPDRTLVLFQMKNMKNEPLSLVFSIWTIGNNKSHVNYLAEVFGESPKTTKVTKAADLRLCPPALIRKMNPKNVDLALLELRKENEFNHFPFFSDKNWLLFESDVHHSLTQLELTVCVTKEKLTLSYCLTVFHSVKEILEHHKVIDGNEEESKNWICRVSTQMWDEEKTFPLDIGLHDLDRIYGRSSYLILRWKIRVVSKDEVKNSDASVRKESKAKQISAVSEEVVVNSSKLNFCNSSLKNSIVSEFVHDIPYSLVWKGILEIVDDKNSKKVIQKAWISSVVTSPLEASVLNSHSRHWNRTLKCVLVHDKVFMEALEKSDLANQHECLVVTFAPRWEQIDEANYEESSMKIEETLEKYLWMVSERTSTRKVGIIPYYYRDGKCWCFLKLYYDDHHGNVFLQLYHNFTLCSQVFEKLKLEPKFFPDPDKIESTFYFDSSETVYSCGTFRGVCDIIPFYAFVTSKKCLDNADLFFSSDSDFEEMEGLSRVFGDFDAVIIEKRHMDPIMKYSNDFEEFYIDLYFGRTSPPWTQLTSYIDVSPLYLIFFRGHRSEFGQLIRREARRRLEERIFIVRIPSSKEEQVVKGYFLPPKHLLTLTKLIVEYKSSVMKEMFIARNKFEDNLKERKSSLSWIKVEKILMLSEKIVADLQMVQKDQKNSKKQENQKSKKMSVGEHVDVSQKQPRKDVEAQKTPLALPQDKWDNEDAVKDFAKILEKSTVQKFAAYERELRIREEKGLPVDDLKKPSLLDFGLKLQCQNGKVKALLTESAEKTSGIALPFSCKELGDGKSTSESGQDSEGCHPNHKSSGADKKSLSKEMKEGRRESGRVEKAVYEAVREMELQEAQEAEKGNGTREKQSQLKISKTEHESSEGIKDAKKKRKRKKKKGEDETIKSNGEVTKTEEDHKDEDDVSKGMDEETRQKLQSLADLLRDSDDDDKVIKEQPDCETQATEENSDKVTAVEPSESAGIKQEKKKTKKKGRPKTTCKACQKQGYDMNVCNLCGVTHYCSEACRKADLKSHEKECKTLYDTMLEEALSQFSIGKPSKKK